MTDRRAARDALERLADEQAALRRVATLVAVESSAEAIFGAVTDEARGVLESEAVGLLRLENDGTATLVAQSDTPWEPPPLGTRFTLDGENLVVQVLRTGRAARADDWTGATGAVAGMAIALGVRSAVASPVVVEGQLWGTIIAATSELEPLPADTELRIAQFTGLVATAIANAESREARAVLTEEQAALRRVATRVAENPQSEELFSAVALEVAGVLDVRGVIVDRFEADGSQVTLGSAYDQGLEGADAFLGVGVHLPHQPGTLAAAVQETQRPSRVENYSDLEGLMGEAARAAGIGSGCAAPIIVEGRLWGQICVFAAEGTVLPPGTEHRLDDFGKLVAAAISNYDARARLRTLADEQAALRRVATLVATEASHDEIFTAITEGVSGVLGEELRLVRYEGDHAVVVASSDGPHRELLPVGTRIPLGGDNAISRVFQTGAPARLDDYSVASGAVAEAVRSSGVRSAVATPINVAGRLWGSMLVGTFGEELVPPDTEARLTRFAELMATAIANTEARDEIERLAEEQAALRRVATLVARGVSGQELVESVVGEVGRLLQVGSAAMRRYESDATVTTMASWSSGELAFPAGERWPVEGTNVAWLVLQSGRSARIDDFSHATDPIGAAARAAGYKSAVGSPIIVEGELWGLMSVNSAEGPLPPDTEARLSSFTDLVATAIANSKSSADLAASRRRIVAASDQTRRQIERDLHDGTQQRLVSLGLAVRAVEADVPSDREDLRGHLSDIASGLVAAIEDLQELTRGLHPAILSKGGLGPALRSLAHRSPIRVDLDISSDGRLAEPVEVAAYFVASEALANAAKYSEASRIDLSLVQRDGSLLLSVSDDGVGGADATRGSGLIGLADRVEALGGSLRVSSRTGAGTQITAELPLELADGKSPVTGD